MDGETVEKHMPGLCTTHCKPLNCAEKLCKERLQTFARFILQHFVFIWISKTRLIFTPFFLRRVMNLVPCDVLPFLLSLLFFPVAALVLCTNVVTFQIFRQSLWLLFAPLRFLILLDNSRVAAHCLRVVDHRVSPFPASLPLRRSIHVRQSCALSQF
jgi:hypothetical protein